MSIDARAKQNGKIFGDWDLKELLGQGSNGRTAVFKMTRTNRTFEETCAMKVVNIVEQKGNYEDISEDYRKDFEQYRSDLCDKAESELSLMNQLRGSGMVVNYHDYRFVDWSDEKSFGTDLIIRMDCLESLGDISKKETLDEKEILKIGSQIANALISCHELGIIHRDIKPDNIFRNSFGNYLLGDFGISKMLSNSSSTQTKAGTESYGAPEQFMGGYDSQVDIYSLGISLYELANRNRLPFARTSFAGVEEITRRLSGEKIPLPESVSKECGELILKACEFKPEDRYAGAAEMKKAIDDFLMRGISPKKREEKHVQVKPVQVNQAQANQVQAKTGQKKSVQAKPEQKKPVERKNFDIEKYKSEISEADYIKAQSAKKKCDYVTAEKLYKSLAEKGNEMAGVQLAILSYTGLITKDYEDVRVRLEEAAKCHNPIALVYIANMIHFGNGYVRSAKKSKEIITKCSGAIEELCKLNDGDALYIYGLMKIYGIIADKDEKKGFKYLEKSAATGNDEAKASLAVCYLNGVGCVKNPKKAIPLLKECNVEKNPKVCMTLGEVYFSGDSSIANKSEAFIWYMKAAEMNNPVAQCSLGYMYGHGEGVKQDYTKSYEWYRKAAEGGNATAQYNLGLYLKNGIGTSKNESEANKWFTIASKQGNKKAGEYLTVIG